MPLLDLLPAADCRFDAVALGEVMLRLDPGEGRIRTAREFRVFEGGGEYNVVRGLAGVFGLRAAVVTALVDNEIGRLVEGLIRAGGVDTSWIRWIEHDGIGRSARNGLNFTERGFGVRPPLGVSDRANSATSQLNADSVDWDDLFGQRGVRWFHTGGVLAGLSPSSADAALAAVEAARRYGTVVSYDLNHRPSLWRGAGGLTRAREVHRSLLRQAQVIFGEPRYIAEALGVSLAAPDDMAARCEAISSALPELRVVACTSRKVRSASANDWSGVAWSSETGAVYGSHRQDIPILDRVGAGDSFASGAIVAILEGKDLTTALEYGLAHGALTMTTPGDTSMASRADVLALAVGGTAPFDR